MTLSIADSKTPDPRSAGVALLAARAQERAGHLDDALSTYTEAVRLAETSREREVLVEALRRLGVVHHRRNNSATAGTLCRRSYCEAFDLGHDVLAGEALNTLGGFHFESGDMSGARQHFEQALEASGDHQALRARVEQNLGIVASVRGDYDAALEHYRRSLEAFALSEDERGVALAWHNLGLIGRAQGQLELASRNLAASAVVAERIGDTHLLGLCALSHAEVAHARQQYGDGKRHVETALTIFERLGVPMDQSGAHRVMGMIYRDSGWYPEAAEEFSSALQLAVSTGWILGEAEVLREMAILNLESGRNQEAMSLLAAAHGLFNHVEALEDVADVSRRMSSLAA